MTTEIAHPVRHAKTPDPECVQENNSDPLCIKIRSFCSVIRMAFAYGIRLLVFIMNLVLNRHVRELYSNWYTMAMAWTVLFVIGGVSTAYANLDSNTTSSNAITVPFGTSTYETVNLSIMLIRSLSVAAYNDNTSTDARRNPGIGLWGVGISVPCRPEVNRILQDTSEFDKVASAVASTIMFLVPALLSFAPLPTASIRTLLSLKIEVAFCTAAMTLGVYNKSLSTLRSTAVMKVKDLCDESISIIILHGRPAALNGNLPVEGSASNGNLPGEGAPPTSAGSLSGGETPTLGGSLPETEALLDVDLPMEGPPVSGAGLHRGGGPSSETHSITPTGLSTNPVISIDELCKFYGTSPGLKRLKKTVFEGNRPRRLLVILVTTLATIAQLVLLWVFVILLPQIDNIEFIWVCLGSSIFTWWVGGAAMLSGIVRTFAISSFVVKDEVFHLSPLPCSLPMVCCENCSVAVKLPPTQTAGVRFRNIFICTAEEIMKLPRVFKPSRGCARKASWAFKCIKLVCTLPHPTVVVLRLVPLDPFPVRHPITALLFGLLQAIQCVCLAVLFGSIWGGTLFYTLGFVSAFTGTIFMSRAFSVILCLWLERALSMTVIECETVANMTSMKRILVAMPDVLVEGRTNFYRYSGGYRLDTQCQNHNRPTDEIQNAEENPSPKTLGVIIGLITGLAAGALLGFTAYTVSTPQLLPVQERVGLGFFGDDRSRLVIGLTIGFCFALMFFGNAMSEFGALSGHVIKSGEIQMIDGLAVVQSHD